MVAACIRDRVRVPKSLIISFCSFIQSPVGGDEIHIDLGDSDKMQLLGMISNPFQSVRMQVSEAMTIL